MRLRGEQGVPHTGRVGAPAPQHGHLGETPALFQMFKTWFAGENSVAVQVLVIRVADLCCLEPAVPPGPQLGLAEIDQIVVLAGEEFVVGGRVRLAASIRMRCCSARGSPGSVAGCAIQAARQGSAAR